MGTELHQILRSLCCNSVWKYAVFWKLKHRARMILTWEDGYYDNCMQCDPSENKVSTKVLETFHYGNYSHDPLGLAVAKMSYHVYSLGEGIVGQVAATGKDRWITVTSSPSLLESLSTSIEGGAKWLVNKLKGKMQTPLPELLKQYDLAVGIFPRDATNYEFDEPTGKLTVYIPEVCEVGYKDSSVLRFSTTVTGYLEKGKLADIEGIKTKVVIWVKVTSISSDGSKLHFAAGMKKTRSRDAYEVLRDGVVVDKF